jgi:hypothetical protein
MRIYEAQRGDEKREHVKEYREALTDSASV